MFNCRGIEDQFINHFFKYAEKRIYLFLKLLFLFFFALYIGDIGIEAFADVLESNMTVTTLIVNCQQETEYADEPE